MTLEAAQNAARKAVQFDSQSQSKQAMYYYNIAIKLLNELQNPAYDQKVTEYRDRVTAIESLSKIQGLSNEHCFCNERETAIENLHIIITQNNKNLNITVNEEDRKHNSVQPVHQSELQRCMFLVNQAQDADESGVKDVAIKLYTNAAELGLKFKTTDSEVKGKLTALIRLALDRAESLKGIKLDDNNDIFKTLSQLPAVPETSLDEDVDTVLPVNTTSTNSNNIGKQARPPVQRGSNVHPKASGGSSGYSDEEKWVLHHSSHINDHKFLPFMSIDLTENFHFPIPFTDKDGFLELAPKQKLDFARWCRPEELFSEPTMLMSHHVDYYSIKQTVVSDCSFVASLAVSAQYERRFGRKLITSVIYPQNRNKEPIYNPFGKYMVKLHINGVPRKVIIDDLLPVSRYNQLLCSYSSNRGELWISLLEKAYMKVMGGYDFPGSNSNIDLHALTSWIPERWAIRPDEPDFNKDQLFNVLLTRLHKGDVLVTVATGKMSDVDTERTGLVPTHAYAVLDVRKVNDERLLLLKNPWSHLRWKGNYSELDTVHWTNELKETLNYDPDSASQFDNGIFWIDYDSICRFFDVFYLNWNPGLFNHTYCMHQMWNAGVGPAKDVYNIGDNPQYLLEVQSNVTGAIWILLTRHITDIADFRQNQEYITVLVYKNDGKRVYYPHDPPPYINGVKINSPHYLCKIKLDSESHTRYTLVISQYEKTNTIYYTLRAYGTCPFTLRKMSNFYKHEKEITDGQWKGITAGGCINHPTYPNNPRYQLLLESSSNENYLLIILKGPKQYQIGFDVVTVVLNDPDAPGAFKTKNTGPFRSGFIYLELDNVPAGSYNIVPSTYNPGQEGPFFLTCKSSCKLQLQRLQ